MYFDLTFFAPIIGMGPGSGNTSIRLTTATPAASASVQLVPMNIAANIRPQGGSMANPSAVRPGVSIPSSRGPASFRYVHSHIMSKKRNFHQIDSTTLYLFYIS